ncbi:MAG TPA: C25 family cysteine peptidase [Thermoanaerobaculia bacterium]|nr:C25 family cysteine peptidase [Thermoanaerobaculia bacterium]
MLNRGRNLLVALLALALPLAVQAAPPVVDAVADASGKVLITWTPAAETGNLGFNVYRETSAGRARVNRQLIAGSAFFTAKQVGAGRGYRWKDQVAPGEFAQYSVESVSLNGTRIESVPVTPLLKAAIPVPENTDTLAGLGSAGGIFVSPRGIGAPSYPVIEPSKKQREQQYDLANETAVKLMVTHEGWYRVTKSALAAAGFTPKNQVSLFSEGVEQPIVVTADAIEFYGVGIDTPAAGARAYWLANDNGMGSRVVKLEKPKGTPTPLARTPFTFSRIERTVFFTGLTNNGDRENFLGAIVTNFGASQSLTVENLDLTGGNATMELVLQGGTVTAHAVQLTLNGHDTGTVLLTNRERKVTTISVPLARLNEGANTLALTALNGDLDVTVVESLRLTYPHRLVADDNALKVSAAAGSSVAISGFTSARVRAFDVTDTAHPIEINITLNAGSASFVTPGPGTRSILVIGDSRIAAPAQVVASRATKWNNKKNSADMVIISARSLAAAAEPLRAHREAEGLATTIIDVQDLYDEFNFGHRGPEAIRRFLLRTREWRRSPRFVLFVGDASLDPRNYLGLGTFDLIPTKLVGTEFMKTASDDWFVDFDDTGLPQLAIGRIPARTVAEAELIISRTIARDTTGNDTLAFLTDIDPAYDFDANAASLAALTPASLPKTFAKLPTQASFESLVLTYIGHGSVDLWYPGFFTGAAARQLQNQKLPIVVGMTCLNGYFHDAFMSSFIDALLTNPDGGAVAVWTSSGFTYPMGQIPMAEEMFRHFFAGATLGEAAMRSKAATDDMDVRKTWIVFGDPAMKLRE